MRFSLKMAILACLVVSGIGAAPAESRGGVPLQIQNNADHHYHVSFRSCSDEPWRLYGSFEHSCDALAAARYLRSRGYEVHID